MPRRQQYFLSVVNGKDQIVVRVPEGKYRPKIGNIVPVSLYGIADPEVVVCCLNDAEAGLIHTVGQIEDALGAEETTLMTDMEAFGTACFRAGIEYQKNKEKKKR